LHINHRRVNRQEYPYSNAAYNRVEQDAANKARRRADKKESKD